METQGCVLVERLTFPPSPFQNHIFPPNLEKQVYFKGFPRKLQRKFLDIINIMERFGALIRSLQSPPGFF